MYRIKQNEVELQNSNVESGRVKQSHGRVCRVQQNEVEPWDSYVESSRVKQSHGRVMQSLVE